MYFLELLIEMVVSSQFFYIFKDLNKHFDKSLYLHKNHKFIFMYVFMYVCGHAQAMLYICRSDDNLPGVFSPTI